MRMLHFTYRCLKRFKPTCCRLLVTNLTTDFRVVTLTKPQSIFQSNIHCCQIKPFIDKVHSCENRLFYSNIISKRTFSSSDIKGEESDIPSDPEFDDLLKEIQSDFKHKPYINTNEVKEKSDDQSESETEHHPEHQNIEDVESFGIVSEDSVEPEWTPSISLIRGRHGVFEVDELCALLQDENAKDLCVIEIPSEARFGDHMVIVNAKSKRHMRAIVARLQWIHKRKKSSGDSSLKIEGLDTDTWMAVDLGNIILHIFMPETREVYDLETLWTVGPKYDDNYQQSESPYVLSEIDLLVMNFKDKTPE